MVAVHAQTIDAVRSQLAGAELAAAWSQGRAMSLDAIVVFSLHCTRGALNIRSVSLDDIGSAIGVAWAGSTDASS
jgi:hypothetical protein